MFRAFSPGYCIGNSIELEFWVDCVMLWDKAQFKAYNYCPVVGHKYTRDDRRLISKWLKEINYEICSLS